MGARAVNTLDDVHSTGSTTDCPISLTEIVDCIRKHGRILVQWLPRHAPASDSAADPLPISELLRFDYEQLAVDVCYLPLACAIIACLDIKLALSAA